MIVVTLPVLPLFVGFTLDFPLLFQLSALIVTAKSGQGDIALAFASAPIGAVGVCETSALLVRHDKRRGHPLMPHLPLTDMFRSGDILLVRSHKLTSRAIRAATAGEFSHAMICVDPPTMIEAVPGYVRNVTLARCYVEDIKNICVLRYPDEAIAREAGREASLWLDTPYSFLAAVCSVLDAPLRKADEGMFCSRLVAEAFRRAGGDLLSKYPTEKVTPALIENEPSLENVTESLFTAMPQDYGLDSLSALDIEILPWVVDSLSERRRDCAQDVIPALQQFERAHLPEEKIWPSFMRIIELLDTEAAKLPPGESLKRTHLNAIDKALFTAISKNRLIEAYKQTVERQNLSTQELLVDSFADNPRFDIDSIRQNIALSERIDRRECCANHLTNISLQHDFGGLEMYSKLEREAVESMRHMEQISREVIERRRR